MLDKKLSSLISVLFLFLCIYFITETNSNDLTNTNNFDEFITKFLEEQDYLTIIQFGPGQDLQAEDFSVRGPG